ncbi:uncharacterized protein [Palaemon carinicauda]|uniref:uncharacterized protein isoform X1 n=1 Tax=Palaemon carinicauda TaxID=392227 RepID=UPI0035B6807C
MTSSGTPNVTSQSLITEDHVRKALNSDKGSDAILDSWKVVDFTKPGDNYACIVTSVEVKYQKDKQDCEVTYVVKLNSLRKFEGLEDFTPIIFDKEGRFYKEVLPALNEELLSVGQHPLRLPKCFLVSLENGKEQLYFEDLRAMDFKMNDRRKGLSKDHTVLIMNELARLHSASYLLMSKFDKGETVGTKYEFLTKEMFDMNPASKELFQPMFEQQIDTGVMMLEKIGGYETSIRWLKTLKPEIDMLFTTYMKSEKFNSICHGDCWNNNFLFRYDDEGHPIDVMLLDLQMCREASIASDLNYFLYSSVSGDVRVPNIDHIMSVYHKSYKQVLEAAGLPMFFDEKELMEEFRAKNKLGVFFSMGFIPILLMEPEEVPDMNETDMETILREWRAMAMEKLNTNPLCKPRFLSVFDELMETGLIS